jgi:hypothetical protein
MDVPFYFNDDCAESFNILKIALISAPKFNHLIRIGPFNYVWW